MQTELMRQYVVKLPMVPTRCAVFPKAVESSQTTAAPLPDEVLRLLEGGLDRRAFTFLYVATLIPHKNHKTLLAAVDTLRAAGTPARVVLTLAEQELTGSEARPPAVWWQADTWSRWAGFSPNI